MWSREGMVEPPRAHAARGLFQDGLRQLPLDGLELPVWHALPTQRRAYISSPPPLSCVINDEDARGRGCVTLG